MTKIAKSVDGLFSSGLANHQAGRLDEAENAYKRVLKINPKHVDANSLLGTIHLQTGRLPSARTYLEKAVKLQPSHFIARNNLGHVLQDCGLVNEAVIQYKSALRYKPDFSDALNNLGSALRESGRLDEADTVFRQLVAQSPENTSGQYNLGLVTLQTHRFQEAQQLFEIVTRADPAHVGAWVGLGASLRGQKNQIDAISAYEIALESDPLRVDALCGIALAQSSLGRTDASADTLKRVRLDNAADAETFAMYGMAKQALGQLEDALEAYKIAVAKKPDFYEAHNNISYLLQREGRYEEALRAADAALAVNDQFLPTHINRGACLVRLFKVEEARKELGYCLERAPCNVDVVLNLGALADYEGDQRQALKYFEQALQLDPNHAEAHWNRGLVLLSIGPIDEGWDEYDWGMQTKERTLAQRYPYPMWQGQALAGKTLFVYAEQGLGDEVIFASMIPEVTRQAGKVIMQCEPRLAPLFQRSFPNVVVHGGPRDEAKTWLETLGAIDFQCPIGSLGRYLRRTLDSFPRQNPFLKADPVRVAYWKEKLCQLGPGPKVGMAWRSGLRTPLRSIGYTLIQDWEPVFRLEGIHFVNLQYGDCGDELSLAKNSFGASIHSFPDLDLYNDLDDSMALMAALDLTIAVGTATYNFSAGLGKPTWLLGTPRRGWINAGTDVIPWYPSLTPIYQTVDGDWESAMAQVVVMLKSEFIDNGSSLSHTSDEETDDMSRLRKEVAVLIKFHQAGDLERAERGYRDLLAVAPDDLELTALLGTLLVETDRTQQGIKLLERVSQAMPDSPTMLMNMGYAYHQLGRSADEVRAYQMVLELDPSASGARFSLATAMLEGGSPQQALAQLKNLESEYAADSEFFYQKARALCALGNVDKAQDCLTRALELDPLHAGAYLEFGVMELGRREIQKAKGSFLKAIALDPKNVQAYVNMGCTCEGEEALKWFEKALEHDSASPLAMYNLGTCLYLQGRYQEARTHFENVVFCGSSSTQLYENLAATCYQLCDWQGAARAWEKALELGGDDSVSIDVLGLAYVRSGDIIRGISSFKRALTKGATAERLLNLAWAHLEAHDDLEALELLEGILQQDPGNARAMFNRGLISLSRGELASGWKDLAYRFDVEESGAKQSETYSKFPRWRGENLSEKSILICAEQGVGDEILFASCIPDLVACGAKCYLQCDPRLQTLFQRSFPSVVVHGGSRNENTKWLDQSGCVDFYCPAGDLAEQYRGSLEEFPRKGGFLTPDPQKSEIWRDRLRALGPGLKIGIAWRSHHLTPLRSRHYTDLAKDWGQLLSIAGVEFINLQYSSTEDEIALAEESFGVKIHQFSGLNLLDDFDEVAALIKALDLVVTVGISVFSLAGSVGAKTFLVLPPGNGWINAGTQDVPWFPTVKAIRTSVLGEWGVAFHRVHELVAEELRHPAPALKVWSHDGLVREICGGTNIVKHIGYFELAAQSFLDGTAASQPLQDSTKQPLDVLLIGRFHDQSELKSRILIERATVTRCKPLIVVIGLHGDLFDYLRGFLEAMGYQSVRLDGSQTKSIATEIYAPIPVHGRDSPSARYVQLIEFYRQMHAMGTERVRDGTTTKTAPDQTFAGWQLPVYAKPIRALIRSTSARSILDYGAGKGKQYEWNISVDGVSYPNIQTYWGIDSIVCFEPALDGGDHIPAQPCDGVVCTDVLEHVPVQDLPWVVRELFSCAKKFVFSSIACYPATAILPDGTNAHCTVRSPQWWSGFFAAISPDYAEVMFLNAVVTGESATHDGEDIVWQANFPLPKT